jgi:hypothetical protein
VDTGAVSAARYSMTQINGRYPFLGMAEETMAYVHLDEYQAFYGLRPAVWVASRTVNVHMRMQIIGDESVLPFVFSSETMTGAR